MRREYDFYPTPGWCVDRLLEYYSPPGNVWLEPCAGDGAIIEACNRHWTDVRWIANDIRVQCIDQLAQIPSLRSDDIYCSDISRFRINSSSYVTLHAIISNPPFKQALPIIKHCLTLAPEVCMLLRLCFLSSDGRGEWIQENTPDVYVLPNRPSFTGDGKTDGQDYAWMVWRADNTQEGKVVILDRTSDKERRSR